MRRRMIGFGVTGFAAVSDAARRSIMKPITLPGYNV
jgi:hypothetical protein